MATGQEHDIHGRMHHGTAANNSTPHLHGHDGRVSKKLLRTFARERPPPRGDEHSLRGEVRRGDAQRRKGRGDGLTSMGDGEEEREGELQDGPADREGGREGGEGMVKGRVMNTFSGDKSDGVVPRMGLDTKGDGGSVWRG